MEVTSDIDPTAQRLQRDGYVCLYSDEAARLAELDGLVCQTVCDVEVEHWQVSSLIDEVDLAKCGYLSAFPAQLTVAASVSDRAFPAVAREQRIRQDELCHHQKHLTPAACLNIYPMLGQLRATHDRCVTTLATVFRHEEKGFSGLTRLWEFKVREFVFVGRRDFVMESLEKTAVAAAGVARDLGIETETIDASDHFYPTLHNEVRRQLQMSSRGKRELLARVDGAHLSIASFNFHGAHFSSAFEFDQKNTIVTGCVGFGLHRWLAVCDREGFGKSADSRI